MRPKKGKMGGRRKAYDKEKKGQRQTGARRTSLCGGAQTPVFEHQVSTQRPVLGHWTHAHTHTHTRTHSHSHTGTRSQTTFARADNGAHNRPSARRHTHININAQTRMSTPCKPTRAQPQAHTNTNTHTWRGAEREAERGAGTGQRGGTPLAEGRKRRTNERFGLAWPKSEKGAQGMRATPVENVWGHSRRQSPPSQDSNDTSTRQEQCQGGWWWKGAHPPHVTTAWPPHASCSCCLRPLPFFYVFVLLFSLL